MKKKLLDAIGSLFSAAEASPAPLGDIRFASRAVFRRFGLYFLIASAVTASVIWLLKEQYEHSHVAVTLAEERKHLDMNELMIQSEFHEITRDFHVIAIVPSLYAYLDNPTFQNRIALQHYFTRVLQASFRYDRFRLLDTRGREMVRVDYDNGLIHVADQDELKDLAEVPSFKEATSLGPVQVHVSQPELDTWNGKAAPSPNPVIHFSMPVFDSDGYKRGVLLLSYQPQTLLRQFKSSDRKTSRAQNMLINEEGFWLANEDDKMEWGWLPGRSGKTFADRHPEAWPKISKHDEGEIRTSKGSFLFRTLYPLEFDFPDIPNAYQSGILPGLLLNYRWKQVTFLSNEALRQKSFFSHSTGWFGYFLLNLVIAAGCWFLAYLKVQKEAHIAENKRLLDELEDLYENAPCGYHSIDANGIVTRMNRTELDWLGYERNEVVGKMQYLDLVAPEDRERRAQSFQEFQKEMSLKDHVITLQRKDGSTIPVAMHASAMVDPAGNFLQSRNSVLDVTERRRLEQELKRQAHTDVLTGLCNRRHFYTLGNRELSRARRQGTALSVLMIDIDHFKRINDTYGHDAGDEVLKAMALASKPQLRENDLLARLGGEEFAVLLPDTPAATAVQVATRLREALKQVVVPLDDQDSVSFTVSIGVSGFIGHPDDLDALLKRADEALYRPKNSGRNRVCV